MRIIEPSFEIIGALPEEILLSKIEKAARICYKSEDHIKYGSAERLIKKLIKSGHHSVLEHVSISVNIICDRGVSHELVRHRLASYSQESTRYANYSKKKFGGEITVIKPLFFKTSSAAYSTWRHAMWLAEESYLDLIACEATAQEARTVLPNSLKTEIFTTANVRQWRHIFDLRSSVNNKKSHPQMREIIDMIRKEFVRRWPVLFKAPADEKPFEYAPGLSEFNNKDDFATDDAFCPFSDLEKSHPNVWFDPIKPLSDNPSHTSCSGCGGCPCSECDRDFIKEIGDRR